MRVRSGKYEKKCDVFNYDVVYVCFCCICKFRNGKCKGEGCKRNLSLLARGKDYSLYADNNGILYLYYEEDLVFDEVHLYREDGETSKESVQSKMKDASDAKKVIDSDYVVYKVDMGLFSSTYFYVKTPKGNFYSVSKKVKTISANASKLIDEL